ncbi:hypothetical protein O181_049853 [Austropuccinia psidii MF-1]|uniref:Uncharacterized protein n=1 Tax=Austropuccinia psidii MF-1 TaxID=1389203 RepID=A0A9Q3DYA4_9BASI|nr:hypothetical protein [Austropuccinia psidii MF-1]
MENSPVEAPQASKINNLPSQVPNTGKQAGKSQTEGKGKGKVEQALPSEFQNSKERNEIYEQCVQYRKNTDGIQKQGGGKNESIFSQEIDFSRLLSSFETCHKEMLTRFNNFEYV